MSAREKAKETHKIDSSNSVSARYRIGAVSRLTGISPDALRIWERRYNAVSPQRSLRGGRLYSAEDIARLRLIRELVNAGDTIGEVANLDVETLQGRVSESRHQPQHITSSGDNQDAHLLLVGETLYRQFQSAVEGDIVATPMTTFTDIGDFEARGADASGDVLVIDLATLHEDTAARVLDWLNRSRAAHAVVIYRFASAQALMRLPASKCSALRAPVDPRTLKIHCQSMFYATQAAPALTNQDHAARTIPAPPRRYDDNTLAQIAALSSTIKCECPSHLAELITSLAAFERYSTECESRSTQDAGLHAFLHATTSHARHLIENALEHLIEIEDIKL